MSNLATLGLHGLFDFTTPLPNDIRFKVGSFAMRTTTGTQSIAGVGFQPKAIIFWQSGAATASGSWASHIIGAGVGFTTGSNESYSLSGASLDGGDYPTTSRRIADKAITGVLWGPGLRFEADLSSFNSDGFTLNWTTQADGVARHIMYMALGGNDLEAKAISWAGPTSTGNTSVSTVGFQPDCVLHATARLSTITSNTSSFLLGFGFMDKDGGQGTNAVKSRHLPEIGNQWSDTKRYQRTDRAISSLAISGATVEEEASFVSMDTNGFTVNFTTVFTNTAFQYISLALKGVKAKVGSLTEPGSTGLQTVSDVGFTPHVLMITNVGGTPTTSVAAHNLWGIGATDGATERHAMIQDRDNLAVTAAKATWRNNRITQSPDTAVSSSVKTNAAFESFDTNGFTLDWFSINGFEHIYLALAP